MSRTVLNYGETDTYKSSNAREFARWLTRRYKKPVCLISGDSGWGPMQDDIDAGDIIPIRLSGLSKPIAVIKKLSRGCWPIKIDRKTGLIDEEKITKEPDWKNHPVCGYIIEGLTANAEVFMQDSELKSRAIGEPLQGTSWNPGTNAFDYKYTELGEKLVMRSRGTYHHAQVLTKTYVDSFKSLPNEQVPWCYFSAHQTLGEDDNGRPVFGPAICGTANVDKITGWFEFSFHSVSQMYDANVPVTDTEGNIKVLNSAKTWVPISELTPEMEYVTEKVMREGAIAWFMKHPDREFPARLWHAKLGVTGEKHARIFQKWPKGHLWLMQDDITGEYVQSIATLLEMVEPTPV
jgi:hypothetical protein